MKISKVAVREIMNVKIPYRDVHGDILHETVSNKELALITTWDYGDVLDHHYRYMLSLNNLKLDNVILEMLKEISESNDLNLESSKIIKRLSITKEHKAKFDDILERNNYEIDLLYNEELIYPELCKILLLSLSYFSTSKPDLHSEGGITGFFESATYKRILNAKKDWSLDAMLLSLTRLNSSAPYGVLIPTIDNFLIIKRKHIIFKHGLPIHYALTKNKEDIDSQLYRDVKSTFNGLKIKWSPGEEIDKYEALNTITEEVKQFKETVYGFYTEHRNHEDFTDCLSLLDTYKRHIQNRDFFPTDMWFYITEEDEVIERNTLQDEFKFIIERYLTARKNI